MVWLDRMTWKEHNWKTGDREVWERSMWIDLSERVKILTLYVPCQGPLKTDLRETDLNNQVDRMTCSADISQPLFSAISFPIP